MVSVLELLVIYALVCMAVTTIVLIENLTKVSEEAPLVKMRGDLFVIGAIFVILTSPFWIPGVIVGVAKQLWQEIIDKCQSSEEDRQ
jgi:hypothetical protein